MPNKKTSKTPVKVKTRNTKTPKERLLHKIAAVEKLFAALSKPKYSNIPNFTNCVLNTTTGVNQLQHCATNLPDDWHPSTTRVSTQIAVGDFVSPKDGTLGEGVTGTFRVLEVVGKRLWIDMGEDGKALVSRRDVTKAVAEEDNE